MVEDQVDAVVCAYVGLFADPRPSGPRRTATSRPATSSRRRCPRTCRPTPRGPRIAPEDSDPGGSAVREYAELQPELRLATDQFVALVTAILDDAGINYLSVTGRAKSVASFAAKAARTVDGKPLVHRPARGDHRPDRGPGDHLRAQRRRRPWPTCSATRWWSSTTATGAGRRRARAGSATPAGTCSSASTPSARTSRLELLSGRLAQVQIRTVLQHAWAEFEHDIRYKGTIPDEHVPDLDRRFTLAAGLLELADREFSTIRDRLQAGMTGTEPPRPRTTTRGSARGSSPRSWPASTPTPAGRAPTTTPGSPGCCSSWASPRWPSSATCCGRWTARPSIERMDYRYPPGAVRRLDDALLAAYGETYVELRGNAHRVPALRARLEKLDRSRLRHAREPTCAPAIQCYYLLVVNNTE